MVDLNCVMTREGICGAQGTGEAGPYHPGAAPAGGPVRKGIRELLAIQAAVLEGGAYEGCTGQSQCQKR